MRKYFLLMAVLAFVVAGCERVAEQPAAQKNEATGQAASSAPGSVAPPTAQLTAATVALHTKSEVVNVTVEIAQSPEERAHGLMGRESLPVNYGMWFIFPADVQDKFWMKDTLIPLDIIFVGSDNKVVDIVANTVPQSTELLSSRAPYRYALEVNGGFAQARGLQIGDTLEFRIGPAQ